MMGSGSNDVAIIGGILFSMLIVALVIPAIQLEFGEDSTAFDIDNAVEEIDSATDIPGSLWSMFITIYSFFPVWLTLLHVALKIILAILIYRLIRSGGG